jgi:hypothetical protein
LSFFLSMACAVQMPVIQRRAARASRSNHPASARRLREWKKLGGDVPPERVSSASYTTPMPRHELAPIR